MSELSLSPSSIRTCAQGGAMASGPTHTALLPHDLPPGPPLPPCRSPASLVERPPEANPGIAALYREWVGGPPGSAPARALLHTQASPQRGGRAKAACAAAPGCRSQATGVHPTTWTPSCAVSCPRKDGSSHAGRLVMQQPAHGCLLLAPTCTCHALAACCHACTIQ